VPFVVIVVAIAGVAAIVYMLNQQQSGDNVDTSQSNQGDFSQPVTSDTGSPIASAGILALARGVARGEGFLIVGSLPQRSNNPGDLTKSFGNAVTGVANKEGVLIFATVQDGWNALYSQLGLIFSGNSRVYKTSMSILEFAQAWTLGREPSTQEEQLAVAGWVSSVIEELNKDAAVANAGAFTADSTLGDVSA
jgi:hypothetical protein